MEFFDKLDKLYLGQVLVVTRYEKEKDKIINECFMRTGNTTYQKIIDNTNDTGVSNAIKDQNSL